MMYMQIFHAIKWVCVAALLVNAGLAMAHGSGGSIEVKQNGFLIDVGYSQEELVAGETTQLSFLLYDSERDEEILFTDVLLRLEQDGQIVFGGLLARPEIGDTSMSYEFPHSGDYNLFVRYKKDDATLVEHMLRLSVAEGETAAQPADISFSARALAFVSASSFLLAVVIFGFFPLLTRGVQKLRKRLSCLLQLPTRSQSQVAKKSLRNSVDYQSLAIYAAVGSVISVVTFFITSLFLGTVSLPDWVKFASSEVTNGKVVRIVLTESGYDPSNIEIERGTTVEFSTTAGRPHWPASNLHPSHTEYSEFDPLKPIESDQSWSFTFDQVGEWGFHDHLRSYFSGKIEVVPAH